MIEATTFAFPLAIAALERWASRTRRGPNRVSRLAAGVPERHPADGVRMEDSEIRLRIERAQAGDGDAMNALFRHFRLDVLRICTRLVGATDAEDATHEAFGRAQRRLDRYDPSQPFRRWLLAIASNHCIDCLRRRTLEKRLFEPDDPDGASVEDHPARTTSALEGLVRSETQDAVQSALDRLPDRYRAPLVMRYFAEQSYDEIGEKLGLDRTQVASLLFRGKKQLRALLSDSKGGVS